MISRYTAIAIYNRDDLEITTGLDGEKYSSVLWMPIEGRAPRLLLSTQPVFNSKEEARLEMQKVIDQVKSGPDPLGN